MKRPIHKDKLKSRWYRHKTLIPAASKAKDLQRKGLSELSAFFTRGGTVPEPESRRADEGEGIRSYSSWVKVDS